ncbi:MFS transporter [Cumulibacter manganitolerans]|uniref:MFS transporter n=1 Tax=Cumulibacter manganitolerans TaxID=1884992 RepID=UPI001296BD54|nr:MFS transporter [Cumulibacter manganitolerans]
MKGDPSGPTLWRSANFRRFWIGDAVSQLGVEVGVLAIPVIAVTLLHATEQQVGNLTAASLAAFLVVGLPAGALVDRWRKRATMIWANVARLLAALLVPALWFTGSLQMWHLYVVAGVTGIARVFFDVCYQSYIPLLVDSAQVPDANSKLESTAQIAHMGGPALGGLLLKVLSAPVLMFADAIGYVASVLALRGVTDSEAISRPEQPRRLLADIKEGMVFVARHPLIRPITICTALANLFNTLLMTLYPLFALRVLGFEPEVLGFALAAGAAGGLIGAATAGRLAARVGDGRTIPLAAMLSGPALALIPAAQYVPERWMAFALLVVGELLLSFSVVVYNVTQVSMRQRACPRRLLGRMNASIRFFVWGIMPPAALLAGWLGQVLGVVPTLWIAAVGQFSSCLPVLLSPLRTMRTFPEAYAEESV